MSPAALAALSSLRLLLIGLHHGARFAIFPEICLSNLYFCG
jgi:hypothetical protein